MTDEKIKPVAWMQSDHMNGPLYPESAITQAREEGRREGMREAFLAGYETAHNHTVEGAYAPELSADDYIDEITRAAEGK